MKKIFFTISFIISSAFLFAQNQADSHKIIPKNNIYINLLGDASIVSLNYERFFIIKPTLFLTIKLGAGYNENLRLCLFGLCIPPKKIYFTTPHHITANFGKGKHFFEFGIGGAFISGDTNNHYYFFPLMGYRLLSLNSDKINFRIFISGYFNKIYKDDIIFVPLGVSIGKSF